MNRSQYYEEALSSSLDEHAPNVLTADQIRLIAKDICLAKEMEAEFFGDLNIPNPLLEENKRLAKHLKIEQEKIVCPDCGGTGREIGSIGPWGYDTQCMKCRGEGYGLPIEFA